MPMNMSYCRFENTLSALLECEEALSNMGARPEKELSDGEASAFNRLVKLCQRIASDYGDEE